ncbi:MAG: HAMP domain-containing protein [Sedimentisphaerales bacterium]|nr:HAMP domain-containing protein [Sedimentisphaerales bacterium]
MNYVITKGKEDEEAVMANLKFLTKTGTERLEHERHIGPEEENKTQKLVAAINTFASACTKIINMKKQGLSSNEILEKEEQIFRPAMNSLLEQLIEHKAMHGQALVKSEAAIHNAYISRGRIALLAIIVIVLSVTVISIAITRSIVNPLHALHKGTEIIGEGNLNFKVATDKKDEIGQLSRAFDKMTGDLMKRTVSVNRLHAANRQLESEITERKKAEEALEISNRELRDFVYVASHDLHEPLRKISSFGQLLHKSLQGKLSDDEQENLEFMTDGADRMTMMIDGLLTYSRVNTKDILFETVDLNKVVEQLKVLELGMLIEETGSVIEIPQPLPKVSADPVQIKQLLQNLIANGIKYRKKGVKPIITLKAKELPDNKVRIEVKDNGIGIAPEYSDEIFKMFRRLNSSRQYEGCGIGLAVCKKIVGRHAGRIGVESEPGTGSTFWFTISLAKDAVPANEAVTVS